MPSPCSPVFHPTRSSALNNGFLVSWSLHPFQLVDCSSETAHIISTEGTYTSATEKKKENKRNMKGLVPKRQISANAKQSEFGPRVRGLTQWTEKSPFLSQYNNITYLLAVLCVSPVIRPLTVPVK